MGEDRMVGYIPSQQQSGTTPTGSLEAIEHAYARKDAAALNRIERMLAENWPAEQIKEELHRLLIDTGRARAVEPDEDPDYGGAFDGFTVSSDADPGL